MKSLDLKNIYDWPLTLRILLLGFLCVAVFYLCYLLNLSSLITNLMDAQQKEKDLKQQLHSIISKQSTISNDISQIAKIQNIRTEWQQKLVVYAGLPELIREILKIGANNNIQFNLFQPEATVKDGEYFKVPIKITAVGNFHQLANFMSQVANMPWIVAIDDFTISNEVKTNPAAAPAAPASKVEPEPLTNLLTANLNFEVFYLAEKTEPKKN